MNIFFEWIILRKFELNIELNGFFSIIQRSIEFSIPIAQGYTTKTKENNEKCLGSQMKNIEICLGDWLD